MIKTHMESEMKLIQHRKIALHIQISKPCRLSFEALRRAEVRALNSPVNYSIENDLELIDFNRNRE